MVSMKSRVKCRGSTWLELRGLRTYSHPHSRASSWPTQQLRRRPQLLRTANLTWEIGVRTRWTDITSSRWFFLRCLWKQRKEGRRQRVQSRLMTIGLTLKTTLTRERTLWTSLSTSRRKSFTQRNQALKRMLKSSQRLQKLSPATLCRTLWLTLSKRRL